MRSAVVRGSVLQSRPTAHSAAQQAQRSAVVRGSVLQSRPTAHSAAQQAQRSAVVRGSVLQTGRLLIQLHNRHRGQRWSEAQSCRPADCSFNCTTGTEVSGGQTTQSCRPADCSISCTTGTEVSGGQRLSPAEPPTAHSAAQQAQRSAVVRGSVLQSRRLLIRAYRQRGFSLRSKGTHEIMWR